MRVYIYPSMYLCTCLFSVSILPLFILPLSPSFPSWPRSSSALFSSSLLHPGGPHAPPRLPRTKGPTEACSSRRYPLDSDRPSLSPGRPASTKGSTPCWRTEDKVLASESFLDPQDSGTGYVFVVVLLFTVCCHCTVDLFQKTVRKLTKWRKRGWACRILKSNEQKVCATWIQSITLVLWYYNNCVMFQKSAIHEYQFKNFTVCF